MSKPKFKVDIVNVVATATLNHGVDLEAILRLFPSAECRLGRRPGRLVFRVRRPQATLLVFGSGGMICVGARSENLAIKAVRKAVEEFKSRGIVMVRKPRIQIRVQNIVASANLGGKIDLVRAAHRLERCIYEPEQHPAVIYRMENPKVVFLIFHSGKIVCTGAKRKAKIYEAIRRLHAKLEKEGIIYHEG